MFILSVNILSVPADLTLKQKHVILAYNFFQMSITFNACEANTQTISFK